MCGIAGFAGEGELTDLIEMTTALVHRGPDGQGVHVDPELRVFLGHRRLAILDVGGGAQPMWNEDGSVAVVFNGEIYNHRELRLDLAARGHVFRSDHSDTEVLVHGYEEWGDELPGRLNGMFAFAILDRPRRRLFLARDRFGEKPLFYAHARNFFGFASELTALARHPCVSGDVDERALQKFFAHGFLPAPNSLLQGTSKLPAGSSLCFGLDDGRLQTRRYWRFQLCPEPNLLEAREEVLVEELRALLFQAVRRRLISDVPLGVFLSGGIDSSTVLAGTADVVPRDRIKTFTVGFTEPSFDESAYARKVAAEFGTTHREEVFDLDAARDLIPQVLSRMDEPLADPSILPTFLLSRFTRRHVTVALSGDGGDELFAGYDPFKALAPAQVYHRLVPRPVHGMLRRLASHLPQSHRNMSLDFKIRRTLTGLSYAPEYWNPVWLSPVEPNTMRHLFAAPLPAEELYSEALAVWHSNQELDATDRMLEFYTGFYLQDDILLKVDRAAMMNSLESRAVFLDNDVVEFCQRLPHQWKYRNGVRKYLLKKAMRGWVPAEVLDRPKKGFGIPLAKWLRQVPQAAPLKPVGGAKLDWVGRQWNEHRTGRADHRLFLWSWLAVQSGHWMRPVESTAEAA